MSALGRYHFRGLGRSSRPCFDCAKTSWVFCRVGRWRGGTGFGIVPYPGFPVGASIAACHTPFPPPAHQTGRADFPHPAFRLASLANTRWLCSISVVTPTTLPSSMANKVLSVTAQPFSGVNRQKPISKLLVSSRNAPEVRLLSSTGITRRHQYYKPVRHLKRPGLLVTEFQLRATTSHRWGFPCCLSIPLSHMPSRAPPAGWSPWRD